MKGATTQTDANLKPNVTLATVTRII